jgi:hypothetical protein
MSVGGRFFLPSVAHDDVPFVTVKTQRCKKQGVERFDGIVMELCRPLPKTSRSRQSITCSQMREEIDEREHPPCRETGPLLGVFWVVLQKSAKEKLNMIV